MMMEESSPSDTYTYTYTYQGVVYSIPTETCSPFRSYPNPLGLTEDDRAQFHPVIQYPNINTKDTDTRQQNQQHDKSDSASDLAIGIVGKNYLGISILDHTQPSRQQVEMATQHQRELAAQGGKELDMDANANNNVRAWHDYGIGRYDENRQHMYSSELFNDTTNQIDGFDGTAARRTLHVGIDLDGPLYTPVHAFWHGVVHAIGYNADLGDYGFVLVVKHVLPPPYCSCNNNNNNNNDNNNKKSNASYSSPRTVFALYGHLADFAKIPTTTTSTTSSSSSSSTERAATTSTTTTTARRNVGDKITRGDILGYLGNIHENGGWHIPHVHFQLALEPPTTHDMPGAVTLVPLDRARALVLYPDPRYVLGPLH